MKKMLVGCLVCLSVAAQSRPAFEVASVKASAQAGPYRVTEHVDADGVRFDNVALRLCVLRAFALKPYQLIGPDWLTQARFVIAAKASGPQPQAKILEMFQALLVDRFKLEFHRETRELPVYALVMAKTGPRLKEAKDDGAVEINAGEGEDVSFHGATMEMLANTLGSSLDRPVFDETGLTGRYDFSLAWSERRRKGGAGELASPDAPSIFTALPARVGLRLEPKKSPVEMFVVDHVERPAEN
jgi:uncharacterized protein (TIGR03435 family)